MVIQPPQAPAYSSWSEYFQQHREEQAHWAPVAGPAGTRPRPRPFTPHPKQEVVDVSSNGSTNGDPEEVPSGDTIPGTPELSNQQVRSADYLGMQSVTACNETCIRGD